MTFKKGDIVICVDDNLVVDGKKLLEKGQKYEITEVTVIINSTHVYVKGIDNFAFKGERFFSADRFALMDKCVCSMRDLMFRGCKCGQIERERNKCGNI